MQQGPRMHAYALNGSITTRHICGELCIVCGPSYWSYFFISPRIPNPNPTFLATYPDVFVTKCSKNNDK
ncbi:hypothetical protein CCHR01_11960 [Colletotrichum chrysophilum]|uniref:Uncharacterized protein n=1 Tax=Colletotrichum chrysophilum TaxID=1836956 RepID=A0AAD9AEB8_9PEZI|nr:hypothetical protein CCHR01_11960 [Colletotrichum chrysophilum]